MHIFLTPLSQVTTLIMAAVCLAALAWGRWPERAGAVITAADWVGGALLQDRRMMHHGQPGMFACDLAMLVGFGLIAVKCRRNWILWAAACALLLNFTHLMAMLDWRIKQWSYMTTLYIWGMGVVMALGAGTALERRRPEPPLSALWQVRF